MAQIWPYMAMLAIIILLWLWERKNPQAVNTFEETAIAVILALITIISFVQVVLRYGFNSGINGALELTTILFAWMILFGMSYAVKIGSHLGVDAFIRLLPGPVFKGVALFGALCAFLYAAMLLSAGWLEIFGAQAKGGAVDYWMKMFKLGIGLEDVKYPLWAQEFLGAPDRVQRWIAYLILPVGLALFGFRALQAMVEIWKGERELIIAGHEAEELVAENRDVLKD